MTARSFVPTETTAAFDHLFDEIDEGVEHLGAGTTIAAADASRATLADFQAELAAAVAGVAARSEADGENAVLAALNVWPSVEGTVAAKSSSAYEIVEAPIVKCATWRFIPALPC